MVYKKVIYLGLDYSEFEKGIRNSNQRMRDLDEGLKKLNSTTERTTTSKQRFQRQADHISECIKQQEKAIEEAEEKYKVLIESNKTTEAKAKAAEKSLEKQRITLQKLKEAMGDIDFTREITIYNEALEDLNTQFENTQATMENTVSASEKLEWQHKHLVEQIGIQIKKVEAYRKEYERLEETYGTSDFTKNVGLSYRQATTELEKMKNALDAMGSLDFAKSITSADEKLEKLNLRLQISESAMGSYESETSRLQRQVEYLSVQFDVQKKKVEACKNEYERLKKELGNTEFVEKAEKALRQEQLELHNLQNELIQTKIKANEVKESMTALGLVLTSIAAMYLSTSKSVAEYAGNIIRLSNETHISTQTLQEWEYTFDSINVSMDTVTASIRNMTNNMQTATTGSNEASKAFTKLSVKITDTHGKMRNSEEVFYDVIDALGKVKNETERDQLAMDIFGESASELAGVISIGSKGLEEYADKAHELGLIMSDESLAGAGEYEKALKELNNVFTTLKENVGMFLIPILTDLVNAIASIPTPVLSLIVIILSIVAPLVSVFFAVRSIVDLGHDISSFFSMAVNGMNNVHFWILAISLALAVLATAIAVVIGKGNELNNSLNSVGNSLNNTIGNIGTNRFQPRYNARGTRSFAGGETWVGEEGPELVNLPPGTRIYNNQESRQIAGGNTYYINMNMDITKLKTVNDVVEAVSGLAGSLGSGGIINV